MFGVHAWKGRFRCQYRRQGLHQGCCQTPGMSRGTLGVLCPCASAVSLATSCSVACRHSPVSAPGRPHTGQSPSPPMMEVSGQPSRLPRSLWRCGAGVIRLGHGGSIPVVIWLGEQLTQELGRVVARRLTQAADHNELTRQTTGFPRPERPWASMPPRLAAGGGGCTSFVRDNDFDL